MKLSDQHKIELNESHDRLRDLLSRTKFMPASADDYEAYPVTLRREKAKRGKLAIMLMLIAILALSLISFTVSAEVQDKKRIAAAMIPIVSMLLAEDEDPKKCYLTEDRVDQYGNWSGVKVEVECKCYLTQDILDKDGIWTSIDVEVDCNE